MAVFLLISLALIEASSENACHSFSDHSSESFFIALCSCYTSLANMLEHIANHQSIITPLRNQVDDVIQSVKSREG